MRQSEKGKNDNSLVPQVIALVEREKLSGGQFAKRLGVDHALWSRVKDGKQPPRMKFLVALIREFPEMKSAVYDYMENQKTVWGV